MSDLESAAARVEGWLQPLPDEGAPCGPDLEYDNDFLALNLAAAGKAETQFGPAEPPDWRNAFELAQALLDRTRDLRVAIFWLRAGLHQSGFGFLPVGLRLLNGLVDTMWEHVHPLPDPDDGDPYARVNALTLLRENDAIVGDLRATNVIADRAIGLVTLRHIEVALGHADALADETVFSRDQVSQMLGAAIEKDPALKAWAADAERLAGELVALCKGKLDAMSVPDFAPMTRLLRGVVTAMPALEGLDAIEEGVAGGGEGAAAAPRRGLSGGVSSRDEAIRAIDMVCAYLESAEPTNPAPLFLRRARNLIRHNFLQLMKELAPDAMGEVARIVGVDPESVQTPDST